MTTVIFEHEIYVDEPYNHIEGRLTVDYLGSDKYNIVLSLELPDEGDSDFRFLSVNAYVLKMLCKAFLRGETYGEFARRVCNNNNYDTLRILWNEYGPQLVFEKKRVAGGIARLNNILVGTNMDFVKEFTETVGKWLEENTWGLFASPNEENNDG